MKLRIVVLLFAVLLLSSIAFTCDAQSMIPEGVKDEYQYNKSDESIILVKKRLQELGYFAKDAKFSSFISDELKREIINFQKQNGLKANGNIDSDVLRALFSEDAVGKDGKKLKNKAYSETRSNRSSATGAKQTDGNETLNIFLVAACFVAGFAFLILVGNIVSNSKADKLIEIFTEYDRIRKEDRIKKTIKESGIILELLPFCGEYLCVPLRQMSENYTLRFDSSIAAKAMSKKECKSYPVLEELTRRNKQDKNVAITCDAWGVLKDGKTPSILQEHACELIADTYKKVSYLYASLNSAGLIQSQQQATRDAFFLLIWECIRDYCVEEAAKIKEKLDGMIDILEKDILPESQNYRALLQSDLPADLNMPIIKAVYILYEIQGLNKADITYFLSNIVYVEEWDRIWYSVYISVQEKVHKIIEIIEKQRYVNNLLNNEKRNYSPRISIDNVDSISPAQFEKLIAVLFGKMGYEAKVTKLSGDQGVDVVAERKGRKAVIQAKCYSGSVGNKAVQEVAAGMMYYKASEAYVITNSYFTKSAIDLAKATHVILWNRNELENKLNTYSIFQSELS